MCSRVLSRYSFVFSVSTLLRVPIYIVVLILYEAQRLVSSRRNFVFNHHRCLQFFFVFFVLLLNNVQLYTCRLKIGNSNYCEIECHGLFFFFDTIFHFYIHNVIRSRITSTFKRFSVIHTLQQRSLLFFFYPHKAASLLKNKLRVQRGQYARNLLLRISMRNV